MSYIKILVFKIKTANFFNYYLFYFLTSLLLFYPILKGWKLNGDDGMVFDAILSFSPKEFFGVFFDLSSGRYAPLAYLFYAIYIPFRFSPDIAYIVNLLIWCFVPTYLTYIISNKKSFSLITLSLGLYLLMSPLVYWYIFSIASLGNTLSLITILISVHLLLDSELDANRRLQIAFINSLISVFIREWFIINFVAYFLILLDIYNYKWKKVFQLFLIHGIVLAIYFVWRAFFARSLAGYEASTDLSQIISKLKIYTLWIFGYPYGAGWQYGADFSKTIILKLLTLSSLFTQAFLVVLYFWRTPKKAIWLIILVVTALLPVFSITRSISYQIVPAYLIYLFLLFFALNYYYQKYPKTINGLVVFLLISALLTYKEVFPSWQKLYFLGANNQTANEYLEVINTNNHRDKICLINMSEEISYRTRQGKIAIFALNKNLTVYTSSDEKKPTQCEGNTLIIDASADHFRVVLPSQPIKQ